MVLHAHQSSPPGFFRSIEIVQARGLFPPRHGQYNAVNRLNSGGMSTGSGLMSVIMENLYA